MAIKFAAPAKPAPKPVARRVEHKVDTPAPAIKKAKSVAIENDEPRGRGRPSTGKERVTIRLSSEVLAAYRAMGDGWQTRIDEALRASLKGK